MRKNTTMMGRHIHFSVDVCTLAKDKLIILNIVNNIKGYLVNLQKKNLKKLFYGY